MVRGWIGVDNWLGKKCHNFFSFFNIYKLVLFASDQISSLIRFTAKQLKELCGWHWAQKYLKLETSEVLFSVTTTGLFTAVHCIDTFVFSTKLSREMRRRGFLLLVSGLYVVSHGSCWDSHGGCRDFFLKVGVVQGCSCGGVTVILLRQNCESVTELIGHLIIC